MKLLVVDDEELTRQGIISSINWDALNIQTVLQAEDGLLGFNMAKAEKPDIIISDIRMPRMSGIEMAEKILAVLPETSIIFMSGYSDREYLKAAIKLKAVSYVEKPINPMDIEEAICEAIEANETLRRNRRSVEIQQLEKASRLALSLTYPSQQDMPLTAAVLEALPITVTSSTVFTTLILKSVNSVSEIPGHILRQNHEALSSWLTRYKLSFIHVEKHDQYLIYHIYGATYNQAAIRKTAEFIRELFSKVITFFVAVGKPVVGLRRVYTSYSSAVFLLQSSFFFRYNSILPYVDGQPAETPVFQDPSASYQEALLANDAGRVEQVEQGIFATFDESYFLLPTQVKDIYYKLFMIIQNTYRQLQLSYSDTGINSESILSYVQDCHTLLELHQLLRDKSAALLKAMEKQAPESPTIVTIKNFINHNYRSQSLSVKGISEHVHMSSSYVCTLFKSETGVTLNQFITEYRIEKAKQLLADSQYKISDISAKVGYTDGNYFGKSFKKYVGLSPSEYREKMLI
ncbi:MAG: helix-turn-helix domain-containing protein [Lachnospiraceae bacterium]